MPGTLNNQNRLVHGERSKRWGLPLYKAADGDETLFAEVNKWRRSMEAELLDKFGELSGFQEARLATAANWELCRRRRMRLANGKATPAERVADEEAAAMNGERRDKALEQAGLGRPDANGHGDGIPPLPDLDDLDDLDDAEHATNGRQRERIASEIQHCQVQQLNSSPPAEPVA